MFFYKGGRKTFGGEDENAGDITVRVLLVRRVSMVQVDILLSFWVGPTILDSGRLDSGSGGYLLKMLHDCSTLNAPKGCPDG